MQHGEWEIRLDAQHIAGGKRHIHVRRRKKRKGEYSWNDDGTRHDKHKFPVNEDMIGQAKVIAAEKLGIPISSLEFLTGVPKNGCLDVLYEDVFLLSKFYSDADFELIVLLSDDWLIVVSPCHPER